MAGEVGSREKQVHNSIATLEKSVAELTNTAGSLISSLEKVLSPSLAKIGNGTTDKPQPAKAILANSIDSIIESTRRVTDMLNDAQSRLEV
jgi:hypothetical protein